MATTLGEKLREAREAMGLSVREVADQTRISVRYIESIETDDYKPLPGGVFNKGFVKSYARYVGIDEKEALDDYARLMSQRGIDQDEEGQLPRRSEVFVGETPRSPVLTIVLALIILGLLSWGVIAALQWYQNRGTQPIASTNANNTDANTAVVMPTPTPAAAVSAATGLNVQLKAGKQDVPLTPFVDGKPQGYFTLKPNEARNFNAQQSFKVQYSRYRVGELQMTINGQPASVPTTSTNPKLKNSIEFEITRDNFAQFLQGSQPPNAQALPPAAQ